MIATRWTTASTPAHASRSDPGSVTSPSTSSTPHEDEPARALPVADERPHGQVARAERVHHVRADEPRRARDENGHSKFLK